MNEIGRASVYRGGSKLRRFPDVSREDKKLLDQLEPELAKDFRRTVRAESRSDRNHRRAVRALLDQVAQPSRGRRRPTYPPHA